ncbi:MAG: hypothetical protein IT319_19030 [Anaerolineae bacterium]|nr:hypothetical protein [Anaerolineae bacterium]
MSFTGRLDHRSAAPELPDQPIRLVPVHAWIELLITTGVLVAAVLWGFFGTLTLSVERAGTLTLSSQKPEAVTYVNAAQASVVHPGMTARVVLHSTGEVFTGEISRVVLSPTTPEAAAVVGALDGSPIYEIRVTLTSSVFCEGSPCHISIVTGTVRPISRVLPVIE